MDEATFFCTCNECHSKVLSILKNLNLTELDQIDLRKTCKILKKGEYLFKENSHPTGLFCINYGKVKLTTSGENGREQILRLLKAGDVAGQSAVFTDSTYHSSAVALEDTGVCFIPKNIFIPFLHENHSFTMDVLKSLARKLENTEEQVMGMAQKSVKNRLADALLYFKDTYGESEDHYLNIQFSREEIADFVGTSTETIIRLLSEWNNSKLITLSKKKIKLEDLNELFEIASN